MVINNMLFSGNNNTAQPLRARAYAHAGESKPVHIGKTCPTTLFSDVSTCPVSKLEGTSTSDTSRPLSIPTESRDSPPKIEKLKPEIAKQQIPVSEKFANLKPPPKNCGCKKCGCAIFWFPKNPKLENRPYCIECELPPSPPNIFVRAVAVILPNGNYEQIFDLPSMGIWPKIDATTDDIAARLKPLTWSQPDADGWCWGVDVEQRLHMARRHATTDPMNQRLDETQAEYDRRSSMIDAFLRERELQSQDN